MQEGGTDDTAREGLPLTADQHTGLQPLKYEIYPLMFKSSVSISQK
jgi:hypothetical protein